MRAYDGTISTACWMTQNLDLDLVAAYRNDGTRVYLYNLNRENNTAYVITSGDTDGFANSFSNITDVNLIYLDHAVDNSSVVFVNAGNVPGILAYQGGGEYYTEYYTDIPFHVITQGLSVTGGSNNNNTNDVIGMADIGDVVLGPFDATLSVGYSGNSGTILCEANDTKCAQFVNSKYFAKEASGHIVSTNNAGNSYNWLTATLGSGNSASDGTATGFEASRSLCPKGWGLPTGNVSANEFSQIARAYFPTAGIKSRNGTTIYKIGDNYDGFGILNGLKSGSDVFLLESPVSMIRMDGIGGDHTSGTGVEVNLASKRTGSTGTYNELLLNSGRFYFGTDSYGRGRAEPMRCIQK